MLLPETATTASLLLVLSVLFLVLWPNLFKAAGAKWRFELFSIDFAIGVILVAIIAAYTLGTLGADLGFGDSMLVAGRRAEVMAVAAGAVFAFANMLYFGTIAMMGLSNGTLLTFSVFGCCVGLLHMGGGHVLTSFLSAVVFLAGAAATYLSAKSARGMSTAPTAATRPGGSKKSAPPMPLSMKGTITGILAGLTFAAVWPVLSSAQTEELGIGAYGGVLMAAIGVVVATFFLDFFFLNISLEGGRISYANYLDGTIRNHALGAASGAAFTAGALAIYTAKTGTVTVPVFEAWSIPFAAALIAVGTGVFFWQKLQLSPTAKRNKWAAALLFVVGSLLFLSGTLSAR